ncbi:DNA topoisomerase 3-beta-1 isoform X2 [Monomorium pharaonis]|uniref:DNA topoisomerase 3-beta-1 isoform X2 n=1 Tax=Monomorium pharaonis TaxID=307658 RepID=UPI00063F5120|nr:DNA topoisomerase 3-beta-1 isoform X2 [Monomorium pharaonis]
MKTALMVAEKPSLAASLANILSSGRCSTRKGLNGSCSVHEWIGQFRSETVNFKMTSVCGHVMTLDFIGKYNNWDKVDPAELFSCSTEKKEAVPKLKIPYFLAKEGAQCDYLVLWLDCDKEGENICFEVINSVQQGMHRKLHINDIWRARFSAITEKDIKSALANLVKPNENEAKSVDARQELDLRIGCAFTRYQTKFFQGKYGDLDVSLISYGPCQTPTLGFCVQRHDEIQTFKPDPYWVLQVTIKSCDGQDIVLSWNRVRSFDKEVANMFLSHIKEHDQAIVMSIQSMEKSKSRPIALNTVELMRVASSGLGMGPHHAMQIAERLYTQGYISYPRTETTSYPENFDLLSTLKQQQNSPEWGEEVCKIITTGINRPKKGHDAGDHPPITPMKHATRNELDGDSWRLYDYITRHFIATAKLVECYTQPPDYLTEAELISLMEKHGIGTDASIPVHINNICIRNYVTVAAGRKLIPTSLGIVLVHGYQKIDPELVLPTMRSAVEEQLNLIALGRADFHAVLHHTVEIFKQKFHYFVQSIEAMDQLFEVSFSPLSASGKAHSRCGKCRRYMKYIQTKPSRMHCAHCNETYNLPQNGNIRIYKELKCPLDDFELLSWSTGTRGKSYTFCPYCYNNPPFRDMKKGISGCNSCTHPTCPHGMNSNGLSSCLECDLGILVLDPSAAPKWKLGCNRCDVIIHLFENAHKVTVDTDTCDCGAQLVTVEYKQDKSKLPNEATEMSGCVFCTPAFVALVEKHRAVASKPVVTRGRGHTKSRNRGKPKPPKDKMAQLAAYFV